MNLNTLSDAAQAAIRPLVDDGGDELPAPVRVAAPSRLQTSPADAQAEVDARLARWREALAAHGDNATVTELREAVEALDEQAAQVAFERNANRRLARWVQTAEAGSVQELREQLDQSNVELPRLEAELQVRQERVDMLLDDVRGPLVDDLKGDDALADLFEVARRRNSQMADPDEIDAMTARLLATELTGVALQGHVGGGTFDDELVSAASDGLLFTDGERFDVLVRAGDRLAVLELMVDGEQFVCDRFHIAAADRVDVTFDAGKVRLHRDGDDIGLHSTIEDPAAVFSLLT